MVKHWERLCSLRAEARDLETVCPSFRSLLCHLFSFLELCLHFVQIISLTTGDQKRRCPTD